MSSGISMHCAGEGGWWTRSARVARSPQATRDSNGLATCGMTRTTRAQRMEVISSSRDLPRRRGRGHVEGADGRIEGLPEPFIGSLVAQST